MVVVGAPTRCVRLIKRLLHTRVFLILPDSLKTFIPRYICHHRSKGRCQNSNSVIQNSCIVSQKVLTYLVTFIEVSQNGLGCPYRFI